MKKITTKILKIVLNINKKDFDSHLKNFLLFDQQDIC